jgi:hypothetical protein
MRECSAVVDEVHTGISSALSMGFSQHSGASASALVSADSPHTSQFQIHLSSMTSPFTILQTEPDFTKPDRISGRRIAGKALNHL